MGATWQITHPSPLLGSDPIGSAEQMAALGVREVEVFLPFPAQMGSDSLDTATALAAAYGEIGINAVSVHAPFGPPDADLSAAGPLPRFASLYTHRIALDVACVLGARLLVIHAGHQVKPVERAEAERRAAAGAAQLLAEAERRGVMLAVENLPPGYAYSDARSLARLIDDLNHPLLGACLDTGHAHMQGLVVEAARQLGRRIVAMHAHDNAGTEDQHLMPGRGTVPWSELGQALSDVGFAGPILLETRLPDGYTATRMADELAALLGPCARESSG